METFRAKHQALVENNKLLKEKLYDALLPLQPNRDLIDITFHKEVVYVDDNFDFNPVHINITSDLFKGLDEEERINLVIPYLKAIGVDSATLVCYDCL